MSLLASSCSYKNSVIPDIVPPVIIDTTFTIDTIMTADDTLGFIYGRFYENQDSIGIPFNTYTKDEFFGTGTNIITSTSVSFYNKQIIFGFNGSTAGIYNAIEPLAILQNLLNLPPQSCLILFDPNLSAPGTEALTVGQMELFSFDSATGIYRGRLKARNPADTYRVEATFALKLRISSFTF
jgi:hypothetical protein